MTATSKVMSARPSPSIDIKVSGRSVHRYSLARYHEAIESGFLTENDKVELIFGQLIDTMPIGKRHGDCVDDLNEYLSPQFFSTHKCRVQNPITLVDHSEPEPDYALINKESYRGRKGNPIASDVDLLVEVADSSLEFDRTTKTRLYALSGIKEYWIINLRDNMLELNTNPDSGSGIYNSVLRYGIDDSFVSPVCGAVEVASLIKI